ncbi:GSCOCG00011693001-RA-CDS [Cotesia congregata]|nr:GSCOCG00011693001-RA-CDS [Cotesia congregata]
MAAEMFDFKGLRESLIDDIAIEYEWDESEESDSEILFDLQGIDDDSDSWREETNQTLHYETKKNDSADGHNNYYLGRDSLTRWSKISTENSSPDCSDLLFQSAGPSNVASKAKTTNDCFNLFVDCEILKLITHNTNLYIASIRNRYSRDRDCNDTNIADIQTLIGLLLLMNLLKSKNDNFAELWEQNGLGVNVFRLSMTLNRFKFLLRSLRFGDENDENSKKKKDCLSPISNLLNLFIANCKNNFIVGSDVTLYEQIVDHQNYCPSLTSPKQEFSRSGMKIFTLVDTCFNYVLNMKIFVKKQRREFSNGLNSIENDVKLLMNGFKSNLLLMNNLTSFSLLKNLLKNNITAIGKLNGSEPEIPPEFLINSDKEEVASFYECQSNLLLTEFSDKENKNMIILSTLHTTQDNTYNKKSARECYINAVHATERLKKFFLENSISRRTRRFSTRIWFHLLDVASLNSYIVYSINNNLNISRRDFIKQLGLSLVDEAIKKRATNKYLPRQLREDAAQFSSSDSFCPKLAETNDNKPKRCSVCPRSKDVKIRTSCCLCKLSMCKKHMISICPKCMHLVNDEQ